MAGSSDSAFLERWYKLYFKVLKNGVVVDALNHILYVKHQPKHDLLLLCDIKEAEAVLSSNGNYGWHIAGLYNFAPDNQECKIMEITKYEYDNIKKRLK